MNNTPLNFTTMAITIPKEWIIPCDDFQSYACAALIRRYIDPTAVFTADIEPEGRRNEIGGPRGLFHGRYPGFTALALAKASGNIRPDEADVIERWLEENSMVKDNRAHLDIILKYRCHVRMTAEVAMQHRVSAYMTEIYGLIMNYYEEEETRLQEEYDYRSRELIDLL